MGLRKFVFRPGVNREGTNYSNEGGWTDALWSGILGQPEGSTPITDITDQFKLVWDNDKQRFTTGDGYVLFLRDDDVTD